MQLGLFVLIVILVALIVICYLAKYRRQNDVYHVNHIDLSIPNSHEFNILSSQNINCPPAYEESIYDNTRLTPSSSPPPYYIESRSNNLINDS